MSLSSTLNPTEASSQIWDAVVVGAGLAGATLSCCLARAGQRVLLIDKGSFPRSKTCGGTLNSRSVSILEKLGFADILQRNSANRITGVEWRTGDKNRGEILFKPERKALAISRKKLDAAIIEEGLCHGIAFIQNTTCLSTEQTDQLIITKAKCEDQEFLIRSKTVVACDGLGSVLAKDSGLSIPVKHRSSDYIGASLIVHSPLPIPDDRIVMSVGNSGYAGVVRVEESAYNIASAIRLDAIGKNQTPAEVTVEILNSAGIRTPSDLSKLKWDHSKPVLNRRVKAASKSRLLLAGDAAGYREPVTGEGMAWALESVDFLAHALQNGWSSEVSNAWNKQWRHQNRYRRNLVKVAGKIVRYPTATKVFIRLLNGIPLTGDIVSSVLNTQNET